MTTRAWGYKEYAEGISFHAIVGRVPRQQCGVYHKLDWDNSKETPFDSLSKEVSIFEVRY